MINNYPPFSAALNVLTDIQPIVSTANNKHWHSYQWESEHVLRCSCGTFKLR